MEIFFLLFFLYREFLFENFFTLMILGVEDFSDNNNNNKNISREGIMFEGTNNFDDLLLFRR